MIADLKPYEAYIESNRPWLGQVPAHWNVLPNRALFAEVKDREHPEEEMLSVTITSGIIRQRALLNGTSKKDSSNLDRSAYKLVQPSDIAYNKMRAWQGAIGVSELRGIISPAYVVIRLRDKKHVPRYFHHLLRTPQFAKEAERWSYGITSDMWSLRPEHFRMIYVAVPPLPEQAAIVQFLEWSNARLDRAIRAKKKVMALLNEQKQVTIERAVTRGLDPTVQLKQSGILWLGDIPTHWKTKRIKYLLKEIDVRSTSGDEPLLSMRMHHGLVLFAEHFTRPPQAATLVGFKIVRPGQFVVNRMQAGNGVIFASALTGLVSPDYAVFDPIGDADVDFLGELFRSRKVRAKFRAESKGLGTGTSGFLRLYTDRFGAIHVALPPPTEQRAILAGLSDQISGVNTAISRLEREVDLLQEYRTKLISDIVTGKLDVRQVVAALPDEDLNADNVGTGNSVEADEEGEDFAEEGLAD
jgi:type I restriction enzyme, S subunit